jgi:hypothetical protein
LVYDLADYIGEEDAEEVYRLCGGTTLYLPGEEPVRVMEGPEVGES